MALKDLRKKFEARFARFGREEGEGGRLSSEAHSL